MFSILDPGYWGISSTGTWQKYELFKSKKNIFSLFLCIN